MHLISVLVGVYALGFDIDRVTVFRRYSVQSVNRRVPRAVVVLVIALVGVERKAGIEVAVVQVPVGVRAVKVALAAHRKAAQRGGVACQIGEGDIQRTAPTQQHPKRACGQQGGGQNDCCHKIPQRC